MHGAYPFFNRWLYADFLPRRQEDTEMHGAPPFFHAVAERPSAEQVNAETKIETPLCERITLQLQEILEGGDVWFFKAFLFQRFFEGLEFAGK